MGEDVGDAEIVRDGSMSIVAVVVESWKMLEVGRRWSRLPPSAVGEMELCLLNETRPDKPRVIAAAASFSMFACLLRDSREEVEGVGVWPQQGRSR